MRMKMTWKPRRLMREGQRSPEREPLARRHAQTWQSERQPPETVPLSVTRPLRREREPRSYLMRRMHARSQARVASR